MNRKLLILMAASLLIAISAYLLMHRITASDRTSTDGAILGATAGENASISARTESADSAMPDTSTGESTRGRHELCNSKPECVTNPLVPNSEAELRWMQQHGYPTKEESERLAQLSDFELEAEAKRGVLTAMTEIGKRMVERGDSNGMSWYLKAKNLGSIYAYYAQSKAELNRSSGHGFVEAGAFLRVAYILGDHKAGQAIYQLIEANHLGMIEMDAIDRRAGELYQTYAKNRQPAPRPQ